MDPNQPVASIRGMDEIVSASVARQRFLMMLLSGFSGLALVLAAVGLYGVISYSVVQRTQELGVRQALGAQAIDLVRMVLSEGVKLTLLGLGAGVAVAYLATRVLASLLYGMTATDPLTFAAAGLLLLIVALAACCAPAFRAARVDPMVALRYE